MISAAKVPEECTDVSLYRLEVCPIGNVSEVGIALVAARVKRRNGQNFSVHCESLMSCISAA